MVDRADSKTTDPDVVHLEKAMAMTRKISTKVDRLLEPLEREMKVMKWAPEFRAILWEAVMLEAKARWEACDE